MMLTTTKKCWLFQVNSFPYSLCHRFFISVDASNQDSYSNSNKLDYQLCEWTWHEHRSSIIFHKSTEKRHQGKIHWLSKSQLGIIMTKSMKSDQRFRWDCKFCSHRQWYNFDDVSNLSRFLFFLRIWLQSNDLRCNQRIFHCNQRISIRINPRIYRITQSPIESREFFTDIENDENSQISPFFIGGSWKIILSMLLWHSTKIKRRIKSALYCKSPPPFFQLHHIIRHF